MHPRDNVNLCRQRTDLGDLTAVRTFMILQDHFPYGFLLILIDCLSQKSKPFLILRKGFFQFLRNIFDIFFTHLLLVRKNCLFHLRRGNQLSDCRKEFFRYSAACVLMFGPANLRHNLIDKGNDRLIDFMGFINCLDHLILGNLIGSCLNHDYLLCGGSHSQIQVAVLPLLLGRIYHEFSVHHSHLGHGAGPVKRNVRNTGGDCGADHGYQLRAALGVNAHNHIV